MKTIVPKLKLILDYKSVYGFSPPEDRISLIKHISKKEILAEIAGLNYRLKRKNEIYIDTSIERQYKELRYFSKTDTLFNQYVKIARKYTRSNTDFPFFFTRQTCTFGLEEILNSEQMENIENFDMSRVDVWESILKYILAVNYHITKMKEDLFDNDINLESLNPQFLPLNELSIETDQIFTPYRGFSLIEYFSNNSIFADEIKRYFKEIYGMEASQFIFNILGMYLSNKNSKNSDLDFYYIIQEQHQNFYDILSKYKKNYHTEKLITIRKAPFIKIEKTKYLLADSSFLIEKTYSQFLNDFWFDWVKKIETESGDSKYSIKMYRSVFGLFFQDYIAKSLKDCFENYKHSILLMFDDLKVNKTIGELEIADIYFRYDNKIILGQVKSTSIYDKEKFGGSIESLYKNNRNKFFEDFGVNQIFQSLTKMDENIQTIDSKFPKNHSYKVYPCLFVNDKALQTPLMADVFNKRFQELLKNFNVKKVIVNPLTIIHINDLERLEDFLNTNPKQIWELLKYNCSNKKYIPPFNNAINKKLGGRRYPRKVLQLYHSLIQKYNPLGSIDKENELNL